MDVFIEIMMSGVEPFGSTPDLASVIVEFSKMFNPALRADVADRQDPAGKSGDAILYAANSGTFSNIWNL